MNIICKAFSRSGRFLAGALALAILLTGCIPASNPVQTTAPTTTAAPTTIPTETSLPPETTAATTVPETTAETTVPTEPEPQPIEYILSFAGDCTLGTDYEVYGGQGTFVYQVGDNYGYPFEKTLPYFENDDFTMVNLEGVFTEYNVPAEKTYRFRAPPAYAKILTAGSVDVVNIANNHSRDFGQTGYDDTKAALEAENIVYVEDESTATFTTESGLKIGIFAVQFYTTYSHMENCIKQLRADGAEIVIVSFHWGIEGEYIHDPDQTAYAHAAIDYGADIVYGHHPHVLQPIEVYKNGVIYYSLGNFSFGGNRNPYDKDTVVIQQTVIRDVDGSIRLGETNPIPFRLSSVTERNDYQPVPYEEGSDAWKRTMAKLNGTYITKEPEQTTAPTETTAPEETTAPTETTVPEETTVPVETTVPEETTVPAETTAPEETTAPVETTTATQTGTPA